MRLLLILIFNVFFLFAMTRSFANSGCEKFFLSWSISSETDSDQLNVFIDALYQRLEKERITPEVPREDLDNFLTESLQLDVLNVVVSDQSQSQVIGLISMKLPSSQLPDDQKVLHIQFIAVHPDFRKQSVGRFLIFDPQEGAIYWAKKNQARTITITVKSSNEPAKRFLKAIGFSISAYYIDVPNSDGEDEMAFSLYLDENGNPIKPDTDPNREINIFPAAGFEQPEFDPDED